LFSENLSGIGDAVPKSGGAGLQEAELREELRKGGHIQGWLVVERAEEGDYEYVTYLRPSWSRGYRILRTWRYKADRGFRDLRALLNLARSFGFMQPITIYRQGCPELARFKGMQPQDLQQTEAPPPEPVAESSPHEA
jgi:hypothetical protein